MPTNLSLSLSLSLVLGFGLIFFWGNFTFPPELPLIYRKLSDTKKLSDTPLNFQILSLRTLLEKSAHYTLHSKTTPFWVGPFFILVFYFFLKKKLKKKKKGNQGWLRPPHMAGMGWPKPPLGLWGWSSHPESHQEKKIKKKTKWVCAVGGGRTTPKGLSVVVGVAGPPPRAWGWSGHPQRHKPIFVFFFFGGFRGGRTTPKGLGGASATPYRPYGVAEATPWPKRGWSGHPIFGQGGGSSHPQSPPPPPFFCFSFLFFLKKKKIRNGPKLRRFGRAQNGVVLE
jgi:hypothetical protein